MSIQLKIKSKHLALEPAIIRHEERKLQKQIAWLKKNAQADNSLPKEEWLRQDLTNHRRWDVRNEARATYLAIAFLAGKPYASLEKSRKNENNFNVYILPRVVSMVLKYGPEIRDDRERKIVDGFTKYVVVDSRADKAKRLLLEWSKLDGENSA